LFTSYINRVRGIFAHKKTRQHIWSTGRDMNPEPPKYEAGVLTGTRVMTSVGFFSLHDKNVGYYLQTNHKCLLSNP